MTDRDRRGGDAARAAWLYYLEGMTQGDVATRLGVSRSTVIRLLQRAKDEGLVRITLNVPAAGFEAERRLERAFGLARARVVPSDADDAVQKRWLGHAAAETLVTLAGEGAVIAVSWGTTLQAMADALGGRAAAPAAAVVALIGGLHNAQAGTNPADVAEQLGQFFNAPARAVHAPIYVADPATAEALTAEPGVRATLDLARGASLAVWSLGALDDASTMTALGHIDRAQMRFLRREGAVADIACRWIDRDGRPIVMPPTINPIGISLEDLKRIPERLLVAGGPAKREAILAGLRGGFATTLVTDEATADHLIAEGPA